jgi:hypothetical protein
MGLFDYVRSSYDLGPQFTETELQTKEIERGLGGTMSTYWLCPAGYLYMIDYSHTADFVEIQEGDEEYSDTHKFLNFKWKPNGVRGAVRPVMLTEYVRVYPSTWEGHYNDWPTLRLHLHYGRLIDYEDITGHRYD